ncbi:xanthine dehydrogenase, molybdenum binding subunit apoprotein [Thiothrix eikelboomii]|uniref:Xanthine dehydrogenase, molybdenum binding subunit apoprotein n=1 Tax=Thiothrix eikelboomii TaxID=92487 RepID=A0A1T4X190_9GAMM|nr:xanthine dehydrogenase molybdopterin binding subunit [Thiothrix eikelboomii]SKA83352.1 xanthine dehydrogenase, molybdenum binding subunit apoprotein [Thiothrix eikelboomii]
MSHLQVGQAFPHESAALHVSGEARYIDDLPEPKGILYAAVGMSSQAHAGLKRVDLTRVREAAGVIAVMTAADIPGENHLGGALKDEPVLAVDKVEYLGQSIFAVAATSVEAARRAVLLAEIDYEVLPHNLDIRAAVAAQQFVLPTKTLERGAAKPAIEQAEYQLAGRFQLGGQEQFYLEGQIALALPQEDGQFLIHSSTQHPHHVQEVVATVLNRRQKDIVVECRRMGGGFGGKESQPSFFACVAGLLAQQTGQAVKYRVDRDDDILLTGKRHCFDICYRVGFDAQGLIQGIELDYAARCGISADLSGPVNDRSMFHADNAYFLENVAIVSYRCKTNSQSNTAFRGFGGPQGMMGIEYVIDEIARYLQRDALEVRQANFYGKAGVRDLTQYGMQVEDNIIPELVDELVERSQYRARRAAIRRFNQSHQWVKKGIALTPVKFGISFTATFLNQAGALIHIYNDGTVQLNHGGTEMGQGLFTKVAQVVAEELQIPMELIRCTASSTEKVPNASATAASSGSDLNGMAAQAAARTLKQRLLDFLAAHYQLPVSEIEFKVGRIVVGKKAELSFAELAHLAWFNRVSLSATGFYKTPKIHYDPLTMSGRPFYYFAYGAAVSEVEVDTLTGEYRVQQVDILHDVGESLNPALDLGQIEGGFVQGMGWLTTEELWWDQQGRLRTHAPSTYKIPVASDVPERFNIHLVDKKPNREATIYRSKAVGEPPLMLAMSVFFALKEAVESVGNYQHSSGLRAPATPEAVLMAIEALRAKVKS